MQPNAKEEKDNRIEERRVQILDAATIAFARKGYYSTTMDDIVAESDLSKGTLYIYFKSKKEIFLALCDRFTEMLQAQMAINLQGTTTVVEQMRAIAQAYVQVHLTTPTDHDGNQVNATKLTAEFWQQAVVDADVKARFVKSYEEFTVLSEQLVENAIAAGEFREVDVPTLTRVVMSFFDGLSWRWLLMPEDVDWERSVEVLFDMLLRGVRPVA